MKDSHIAILNVPGYSQINPTLSIASTLVRRGYRVTYVTSDRFSQKIAELGAEVLHCPRLALPYAQVDDGSLPIDGQYSTDLFDLASRTLSLVSSFYERNMPDLVLYNTYAFAGLILAERLRVPAVRITSHLPFHREDLNHPAVPSEFSRFIPGFSKMVDDFFSNHGIHRSDVLFNSEEPTVRFYLNDFQLSQQAGDRHSFYAARCAAEQPYRGVWKSKRVDDRRAVLITSSTYYDQGPQYYRMCLEALSQLGLHAVLAIGGNNDAASFDPLPPHCEVVQHIPQIALMPHVDLMVYLGGMTSTMEAMYHGLPLVMVTHGYPELELYAENVQTHGLGRHLKKATVTIDDLNTCIAQILDDPLVRSRVKKMQHIVKRSPGAEEVANWIEEYLEGRPCPRTR